MPDSQNKLKKFEHRAKTNTKFETKTVWRLCTQRNVPIVEQLVQLTDEIPTEDACRKYV